MSEKSIFLLIFFEHAYLTNPHMCSLEILGMHWKRSNLGNCVSEFLFRVYFLFYDKKRETFMLFFSHYFSRFHKIKTRTYIKNLRHSSLDQNVFSMS